MLYKSQGTVGLYLKCRDFKGEEGAYLRRGT